MSEIRMTEMQALDIALSELKRTHDRGCEFEDGNMAHCICDLAQAYRKLYFMHLSLVKRKRKKP